MKTEIYRIRNRSEETECEMCGCPLSTGDRVVHMTPTGGEEGSEVFACCNMCGESKMRLSRLHASQQAE